MTPEQFLTFARSLPDPLCLIDSGGLIVAANPAAAGFFGFDSSRGEGRSLFDLVADDRDGLVRTLRTWSRSRDATPGPLQVYTSTGRTAACHGYGALVRPATEEAPALIMVRFARREQFTRSFSALNEKITQLQRQIVERQETENSLARSKAEFEAMFNAIPDAVMFADTERRIVMNNPAVQAMFGYGDEELIGHTTEMLYADRRDFSLQGKRRFNTAQDAAAEPYQVRYRHKDGTVFWTETRGTQVRDADGRVIGFLGLFRDISERKRVEQALVESEQRLNEAQRIAHLGNWELDLASNEMQWSDEIYRIFGLEPRQVEPTWAAFVDMILPDDRERVSTAYRESIGKGTADSLEYRVRLADGGIKHVLERREIFYADDGRSLRAAGTLQDISERVGMEEALRRSQKMDAIGQLSGGIAHDFNNQLGIVIGYLDFLRNHFREGDKPRQWVDTATRATLRCMDLTRKLLAFSRRQGREKTVVDLNDTLQDLDTMVARLLTPEIGIQYCLADELWSTEIDPGEFQDAILNLVLNARDAMPNSGRLLIETSNRHLDADYAVINPGIEAGDYVQLMLSDTGTGMGEDVVEHIFEPFFTTKPEGKGTGLGLPMVYGFVRRYGGHIKVYTEPGVGTTVRLYLPRSATAEETAAAVPADVPELPCGDETILVVDDEADLLQLADRYLSDLGYRTRLARDAAQALEILEAGEGIDLLFSDVVMPGPMNGYELAQQASDLRPAIKVLLTSGFTSKTMAHNGLARFSAHLLGKPYRKAELAHRVRRVLDGVAA